MIFMLVEWIRGWLLPYPFWIKDLGRKGEYLARRHWHRRGYHLVARNWRHGNGEIDAIMANPKHVVFLEVKSRTWRPHLLFGEQVSRKQKKRLLHLRQVWLNHWHESPPSHFYLVVIIFRGKKFEIRSDHLV